MKKDLETHWTPDVFINIEYFREFAEEKTI